MSKISNHFKSNFSMLRFLVLFVAAIIVCSAFVLGENISFKLQWPLYETLRTTASIILAITAAWVAIIYPERLKLFKETAMHPASLDTASRFSVFLQPIIISLTILCIVLLVGILAPIASQINAIRPYSIILRQSSYAFLAFITLCQIYTVLAVFVPIHLIKQSNDTLMTRESRIKAIQDRNPSKS